MAATARPSPEIMSLVDVKDGDTLVASTDPASGFPIISIQVQARRADNPQITLETDGLQAAISSLEDYPPVQTVALTWTPWHGNGTYHLDVRLVKGAGEVMSQQSIAVQVNGIPDGTPTIQERFIQLYQEQFDLNLTAPAFAHNVTHIEAGVEEYNRWVSVAYIQDKIYTLVSGN